MNRDKLLESDWANYAEDEVIELLDQSFHLLSASDSWSEKFHDYSFVVFPAAKAYEAFLKKFFYDIKLISDQQYRYKYFRIGKALNPEIDKHSHKNESVYYNLQDYCNDPELPKILWQTWKDCRNALFHWFPDKPHVISIDEARACVSQIIGSIDTVYRSCKIN